MGGGGQQALKEVPKRERKAPVLRCAGDASAQGRVFGLVVGLVSLAGYGYFMHKMHVEYMERSEDVLGFHPVDYVQQWVPIFVLTIALEAIWARVTGRVGYWRVNDTIGSMSTGVLMVAFKATLSAIFGLAPYRILWENYRVTDVFQHGGWLAWWVMFIGVDYAYYWVHRTGHTVAAFWAMHGVHHSSEECNLTTALRQSSIHSLVSFGYYLPLAFVFPPHLFYVHSQFNLLYQYFLHTEAIGKLGVLEYVFNTPSQHRVHHGRQPYAIDKNYGGTLSIWDRLHGTFVEEKDFELVYGTTHALNSFDAIWANVAPWVGIWEKMKTVDSLYDKLLCLYEGPGWIAGTHQPKEEYEIPPCTRETVHKYDPILPAFFQVYLLIHFGGAIALQSLTVAHMKAVDSVDTLASVQLAFLIWTLCSLAAMCNRRAVAFLVEVARLLCGAALLYYVSDAIHLSPVHIGGLLLVNLIWLFAYRTTLCTPLSQAELGFDYEDAAEAYQELMKEKAK